MIDGYRQAAVHAAQGGIDGVEVCAGFNYLPTQFLSPHVNRRTDEYGGSFENRLRFLREVCEAMREGIGPDGAVGCRLTDEHWSPDANTEDELAEAARVLSDAGLIDYLSVALGSSTTYRGSSWIVPPSPIEHNAIAAVRAADEGGVDGAGDRHRPDRRGRGRERDDRARRLRCLRHDARDDHRPRDAGQGARRQAVHALHRLQPGMHRALPRRPPDRLHDQPLDRVRAAAPASREPPGHRGDRRRRPRGRRGRGVCAHARNARGRVRGDRRAGRPDAPRHRGCRARGDRRRPDRHGRPLAVGLRRAVLHRRDRRRRARRVARPRDRRHRRRALRRRAARRIGRRRVGRAGGRGDRAARRRQPTGAATGPAWPSPSCWPRADATSGWRPRPPRSARRSTSTSATSTWSGSTWPASS